MFPRRSCVLFRCARAAPRAAAKCSFQAACGAAAGHAARRFRNRSLLLQCGHHLKHSAEPAAPAHGPPSAVLEDGASQTGSLSAPGKGGRLALAFGGPRRLRRLRAARGGPAGISWAAQHKVAASAEVGPLLREFLALETAAPVSRRAWQAGARACLHVHWHAASLAGPSLWTGRAGGDVNTFIREFETQLWAAPITCGPRARAAVSPIPSPGAAPGAGARLSMLQPAAGRLQAGPEVCAPVGTRANRRPSCAARRSAGRGPPRLGSPARNDAAGPLPGACRAG